MRVSQGILGLVLLAIVIALVMLIFGGAGREIGFREDKIISSGQESSPTPEPTAWSAYSGQISNEEEAIQRSLSVFPDRNKVTAFQARLISYQILNSFRGVTDNPASSASPVWLVGIIGENLSSQDIVGDFMGLIGPAQPTTNATVGTPQSANMASWPVAGAYYAWDANGGDLVGSGVLSPEPASNTITQNPTFSQIVSMVSLSIPIVTASPPPIITPMMNQTPGANDS